MEEERVANEKARMQAEQQMAQEQGGGQMQPSPESMAAELASSSAAGMQNVDPRGGGMPTNIPMMPDGA